MTPYEQKALKKLQRWQAQEPGWGTRLLAKPGSQVAKLVQVVVPVSALRAALEGADAVGRRLVDERSLLKSARVESLDELRAQPLEICDGLADTVTRRGALLGGATGAVSGIAGAAGMVADVPALLTLAMRTIHRIGLCYGERPATESERQLSLGVFAVVSANSLAEKRDALGALHGAADANEDMAWREGIERVAERQFAKDAAIYSLNNLAKSMGRNLARRKIAGSLPIIGMLVGGAVNAWYLADVAQAARHVFQERWLREKYPALAVAE